MYFLISHSSLMPLAMATTSLSSESLSGNAPIFLVLLFNALLNLSITLFVCNFLLCFPENDMCDTIN